MKKHFFLTLFSAIVLLLYFSGSNDNNKSILTYFNKDIHKEKDILTLVEKRIEAMSLEEKIYQLFLIRIHSDKDQMYVDSLCKIIKLTEIGGVVFFQGTPEKQLEIIRRINKDVSIPPLVAIDAEWGLNMRLDSTLAYPFSMTMGAVQDINKVYRSAYQIGEQLRAVGVHMNFAPVVDINNNANNPVIGVRSFGDNKHEVTKRALSYMKGLSDANVIAVAKHFPGHGDTKIDSHFALPKISVSKTRLDTLELFPYKKLIDNGLPAIMAAHINIPAYDKHKKRLPSTLSHKILTDLLRNKMHFNGLIITDAMEMKGVKKYYKNGNAEYLALKAGNDMICLPDHLEKAVKKIKNAVSRGRIDMAEINKKVKKILFLKYKLGLFEQKIPEYEEIYDIIVSEESQALKQQICDEAVTLLNHKGEISLNTSFNHSSTILLSLVNKEIKESIAFQEKIATAYSNIQTKTIFINAPSTDFRKIGRELKKYKNILLSVHDNRRFPWHKYFYKNKTWAPFLAGFRTKIKTSIFFTSPYILKEIPNINQWTNIVVCYENSNEMNISASKVLLDSLSTMGRLPVTINPFFKTGDGS